MTELTETKPTLATLPINRLNLILLAAVVVQVIIAAIVFWPRGAATTGEPLLGDLTSDAVTALTITDAEGASVTLAKEGDAWVLPNAGDYPALTDNVTGLLEKLVGITSDRLVARTPESHARLQVAEDDFVTKIEMTTADGSETLYVGSAPATGATNVRVAGENNTYLTNQVNSWELNTQLSGWVDTLYFSVPSDDVTRLVLENPQGTFTLERAPGEDGTPGDWTLAELGEEQTLDQSTVSTLLSRVNALRMVAPVGTEVQPEYGLGDPLATVTLTAVNDEGVETVHTLDVGVQDSDTNYYMKTDESEYVVLVASFTGDALTGQALDDFVAQPTATEDGTGDGTEAGEAAFPVFEGAEGAAPTSADESAIDGAGADQGAAAEDSADTAPDADAVGESDANTTESETDSATPAETPQP